MIPVPRLLVLYLSRLKGFTSVTSRYLDTSGSVLGLSKNFKNLDYKTNGLNVSLSFPVLIDVIISYFYHFTSLNDKVYNSEYFMIINSVSLPTFSSSSYLFLFIKFLSGGVYTYEPNITSSVPFSHPFPVCRVLC